MPVPQTSSPGSLLSPHAAPVGTTSPDEAFRELCALADGRVGAVPHALLARHVLATTRGGDWPVHRAAMEAVLRRWTFAKRDALRVAVRPTGHSHLGVYRSKRKGSKARPYITAMASLDPLRASCDCPDFVRNSLGLCKHTLAVLDDLGRRAPRVFAQADSAASSTKGNASTRLTWDPVRPLTGPGDWLARARLYDGRAAVGRPSKTMTSIRQHFGAPADDGATLRDAHANDPTRRLGLVETLLGGTRCTPSDGRGLVCDPALAALLAKEREHLRRALAARVSPAELRRHLGTLEHKLYAYQVEAVRRFLETGRLLLADDMGLGKTVEAIAICHVLFAAKKIKTGLIIVPASLKSQWLREWRVFSAAPIELLDGPPAQREALLHGFRRGFLVANYEQVLRDLPAMQVMAPGLVVLDEAQRIKNWETKTAAYVKQLDAPFRLVLTGTPMENRLEELASIVEWVDPLALEPTWRLGPWHSTLADGRQEVTGARNLDTLRERLRPCMLRRVRREVLDQLPSRTDTRVPAELTAVQREEHDALNQPIASLTGRAKQRPLTQGEFLRLMQLLTTQRMICNGLALYQFNDVWPGLAAVRRPTDTMIASLGSAKLRELRELVAALAVEQRLKIVVFSQWRRMLRLAEWSVQDILARAGLRAAFFSGEESQKRRTQNIIDFHDDPHTAVLFATDAGGVGLNLQRAASCCINLEMPWNPAVLEQRIGRVYRLGQKRPIEVYNLVADEGIESRIYDLVGNKRALFTGLFDGASDEVTFERSGTFMSRVEKLVEPVGEPAPGDEREAEEDEQEAENEAMDASDDLVDVRQDAEDSPAPRAAARSAHSATSPATSAAATTSAQATAPTSTTTAATTSAQVADLFARLRIERGADGAVSIKAPPAEAQALAALFSGMAQMLATCAAEPVNRDAAAATTDALPS